MKLSIIILKFLFIGALFIISNENLALHNPDSREIFYQHYFSWLSTIFDHAKQITGYVVNSGWLPGENKPYLESISSK